jgi:hypothetical protein
MRRLGLLLVVVGLIAAAIWLPREEDVAAEGEPPTAVVAEVPPAVEFRAIRGKADAAFAERWELGYPDGATPSQSLTLQIGRLDGKSALGRLTAVGGGDPAPLLERVAAVLGAAPNADVPPMPALDLRLDLLGERLSAGHADEGATVIAGAFSEQPVGDWRAYRVTFGTAADAPQCFFGISDGTRAAVLLPRALEDGPAIDTQLRALLLPRTARRES